MPPIIDRDECTACGECEDRCPLDVIYMDENEQRPLVKYPYECWHCGSCRQDCPVGAIRIEFPVQVMIPAGVLPY
jgi:NAD-dependent dihydropyrimidine dehydrogenase PreA subunit